MKQSSLIRRLYINGPFLVYGLVLWGRSMKLNIKYIYLNKRYSLLISTADILEIINTLDSSVIELQSIKAFFTSTWDQENCPDYNWWVLGLRINLKTNKRQTIHNFFCVQNVVTTLFFVNYKPFNTECSFFHVSLTFLGYKMQYIQFIFSSY